MKYKIWNKIDKINGIEADHFIDNLKIQEHDEVFLILDSADNVQCVEISSTIKGVYNLDANLSVEEVAEEYIRIKEEEKIQAQNSIDTLEDMGNKISILESENKALREELTQIQTSIASLTSLIATTLKEK